MSSVWLSVPSARLVTTTNRRRVAGVDVSSVGEIEQRPAVGVEAHQHAARALDEAAKSCASGRSSALRRLGD